MSGANDILWDEIVAREGRTFTTHKGKTFSYYIKRPKSGETSGEIVINRAIVITRSTAILAYHGALDAQQKKGCVASPRKLGAHGDVYLYPIFLDIGICSAQPGDPVRDLAAEAETAQMDQPAPERRSEELSQAQGEGRSAEASRSQDAGQSAGAEWPQGEGRSAEASRPQEEQQAGRYCEKCGFTTEEEFDFCPKCGSRLTVR